MRRTREPALLAVLMIVSSAAWAAPSGAVRDLWFHQVPRVETPPAIDGKPGDPCWQKLPALSNFGRDRYGLKSKHPMVPMTMKLGWDDTYLYCLWHMSNPAGEHRVDYRELERKQRGKMLASAMYWNQPSVEFRIDGRRDRLGETVVQMNLVGQKQGMQKIATGWSTEFTAGWDIWADYEYVPGYDQDGWWVELKVALKDMGAEAKAGYVMGAQFRYFHPGAYFAWTLAGYDPAGYGDLILVEEPLPMRGALEAIIPDYASTTVRMPQPDGIVLVARGEVSKVSYREAVMKEVLAIREARKALGASLEARPEMDAAAVAGMVDGQIKAVEEELAKIETFTASEMMRLRAPLDGAKYALRQAAAQVEIHDLLQG